MGHHSFALSFSIAPCLIPVVDKVGMWIVGHIRQNQIIKALERKSLNSTLSAASIVLNQKQ